MRRLSPKPIAFYYILLAFAAMSGAMPGMTLEPLARANSPTPLPSRERVLILGDSLTEGYGLPKEAAFPAVLAKLLRDRGHDDVEIVNAGISGSTSASGPSRLRWLLKGQKPAVLVLALGGNDGLRGLPAAVMRTNLQEVVELAQANGIRTLLAGMKAPPNLGPAYVREFDGVFPALAAQEHIPLMPFLLEQVAGDPALNQEDGIHPNEKGSRLIAKNLLKYLEPLL
jgi:acyl-CoA thioesterase-1